MTHGILNFGLDIFTFFPQDTFDAVFDVSLYNASRERGLCIYWIWFFKK